MREEGAITEQQLAAYEPVTTSGAALKERLEAAVQNNSEPTDEARRVVLR
jgi:hypothetical protein